jgi:hypothetical protein
VVLCYRAVDVKNEKKGNGISYDEAVEFEGLFTEESAMGYTFLTLPGRMLAVRGVKKLVRSGGREALW